MRSMKSIGIMASILGALAFHNHPKNQHMGMASDETLARKFFRSYGPGRSQRKRRKLGRQNPHSKYAK